MAKSRKNIKLPEIYGQLGKGQNPDFTWQQQFDELTGNNKRTDIGNGPGGYIPGSTTGTVVPPQPKPDNKQSGLTMDSDWSDILKNLGSGTNFTQFLASLGIGGTDPYDMSMHDMNQEIIKQILQYYLTSEQRGYDRALQLDQRLYDTPTNQLARLMGAGISRDAAVAMLSGGSGGAGATGVPYGITGNQAQLESASQAYANQMQGGAAVANSVFNGIGALVGLTNLGLSMPQAISQIGIQKNMRYLSDQQRAAYDATAAAFNIVNSAGLDNVAESFGSVNAVAETLTNLANNGNAAAAAFIQQGGLDKLRSTSPYSSQFLSSLYRNERDSDRYDTSFGAQMRKMFAETEVLNCNRDNLVQQTRNLEQELDNLRAQEDYIYAATALQDAHAKLFGAQTESVDLSNELERSWRVSTMNGQSGLQLYTDQRMQELYKGVCTLTQMNNDKVWEKEVQSLLANYDNMLAVYELSTLYANGALDVLSTANQSEKDLLYWCRAADDCGLFDYVHAQIEQNTGKTTKIGPVTVQGYAGDFVQDPLSQGRRLNRGLR